jgi:hypothetical protein
MRRSLIAGALVAVGLAVLSPRDGPRDRLPAPVEAFESRLEAAHGTLHVVTDEIRVAPEPGLPDLPPAGFSDEVWLDLGGGGWRAHRTTRDGGLQQLADERGIHTFTRDGRSALRPAPSSDFLLRPWVEGAVVDPVRLVRGSELRVTGEETVRGQAAYVVEPDPPEGIRMYVARDDGKLLRVTQRRRRADRMRTEVQDYLVFEVRVEPPRSLADVLARL